MRVAVWGAMIGLGLAASARADVYTYRDGSGTLVFTNAPSERATRLVIKDPPLPPARRMMEPLTRERLLGELSRPLPTAVPTSYDALIREIAVRYNVEYALVKAVIKAES